MKPKETRVSRFRPRMVQWMRWMEVNFSQCGFVGGPSHAVCLIS